MKCLICGKETKYQYAFDVDLPKFPHCKKHEIVVQLYVIMLSTEDNFDAEKWLENAKRNSGEGRARNPSKKRK
jgi:hypothetical protein